MNYEEEKELFARMKAAEQKRTQWAVMSGLGWVVIMPTLTAVNVNLWAAVGISVLFSVGVWCGVYPRVW